jgi:hypothetical protein
MAIALLNPPHFSIWCIWSDSTPEDNRRVVNGSQAMMRVGAAMDASASRPSNRFWDRE